MAAASTLPFTTTPHKPDGKKDGGSILGMLFLALHGFISTLAGAVLRFCCGSFARLVLTDSITPMVFAEYGGAVKVVSRFEKFQVDRGVHKPGFLLEAFDCRFSVLGIKVNADVVPAALHCGEHCGAGPGEGIENRVAPEREHPYQAVRKLQRKRCWVDFG